MNIRVNSVSPNSPSVSFKGLTRQMNKHTFIDGQKDIKAVINQHAGKSLIVGQLPKFILNKLPKINRAECIKELYGAFAQVATELREFDETKAKSVDEIQKRRMKSTKEILQNAFLKYKILYPWDVEDFDIRYLGKGGKGAGYKIEGLRSPDADEDEYIIKVYHMKEGKNWQPYKSHGCYAEINSASYWMNQVGFNSQRGKFFFGDMDAAYMVSKYVDDDTRLPKQNIDPYHYGLKCTDENAAMKHNVCKGYSFDWGGVRVVNRLKNESKTARKIAALIKNTPDIYKEQEWNKLFYADKKYDKTQKYAALAMSIKHMPRKEYYIDKCLELNNAYVNRGLSYVLKYLPYIEAKTYFEKLVQTDDVTTQVILFNEIPLLAMKHRDEGIKDDLQTMRSQILPDRIKAYYDISEKYALPDAIEHLASFAHLLPDNCFREYYSRLASIDNYALKDRLIYKLSNVSSRHSSFCKKLLEEKVFEPELKERLK